MALTGERMAEIVELAESVGTELHAGVASLVAEVERLRIAADHYMTAWDAARSDASAEAAAAMRPKGRVAELEAERDRLRKLLAAVAGFLRTYIDGAGLSPRELMAQVGLRSVARTVLERIEGAMGEGMR
jgi:hypothetical protein